MLAIRDRLSFGVTVVIIFFGVLCMCSQAYLNRLLALFPFELPAAGTGYLKPGLAQGCSVALYNHIFLLSILTS